MIDDEDRFVAVADRVMDNRQVREAIAGEVTTPETGDLVAVANELNGVEVE